MTFRQPDSVVPRRTAPVQSGRAREAEPERTRSIDTAILAARLTRSVALPVPHGL
jgi:hypothetical protein